MAKFAADPYEQFEKLMELGAPASSELRPDSLKQIIDDAAAKHEDVVWALASHVADNTPLTLTQAHPMVDAVTKEKPGSGEKADAVSKAVSGLAGGSAKIELSDPVMLNPEWRTGFAGVLVLALGACIGCVTALAKESHVEEVAVIGLVVFGVLAIIAILVLVMGYKSVNIQGAGPSAGG